MDKSDADSGEEKSPTPHKESAKQSAALAEKIQKLEFVTGSTFTSGPVIRSVTKFKAFNFDKRSH